MTPLPRLHAVLLLCALAVPGALCAQSPRIFVASYGSDTNTGTSLSPKRNFQAAHDAVNAKGEIVVLDTAGYGVLAITKSVTITVPSGVTGFITGSGSNGITINAAAADVVSLHGLVIEGIGTGINVTSVGTLELFDCAMHDVSDGVFFSGVSGAMHLLVQGGSLTHFYIGVEVSADNSAAVDAVINGCTFDLASYAAVYAFANTANSVAKATVRNCTVTHGATGLYAYNPTAAIYVDNCLFAHNANGVRNFNNGALVTRGNNTFESNPSDGSFTNTLEPK